MALNSFWTISCICSCLAQRVNTFLHLPFAPFLLQTRKLTMTWYFLQKYLSFCLLLPSRVMKARAKNLESKGKPTNRWGQKSCLVIMICFITFDLRALAKVEVGISCTLLFLSSSSVSWFFFTVKLMQNLALPTPVFSVREDSSWSLKQSVFPPL